jgi:uncharacterized membrane protein YphA (DoxX/SURF4 family)
MNRLGFFSILAIIALRMCIGWHFYKEGTDKIRSGKFSASGFLGGATGPFADYYHGMVWDYDGAFRLDAAKTAEFWRSTANVLEQKYGFSADQKKQVEQVLTAHQQQLDYVLAENSENLEEYQLGRARIESLNEDPSRNKVSSLRGQRDTIEAEWRSKGTKALKAIDQVWKNLEQEFNGLIVGEQRKRGPFALNKPRLGFMDTSVIDRVVPYFDTTIGVCLLLGLLVRPAALAAGGFLLSVVISQFPGWPDAQPTYFQAVEAIACIFLATVGAGRFAGLDFIFSAWWMRRKAKTATA